jgi:hypothetical protein
MPATHYLCWFSRGKAGPDGFVPADGGCRPEPDQLAWEMAEVLRHAFGINMEAFVPALGEIGLADPERLPSPARCLEVVSADRVLEAREAESYGIKDLFHQAKTIPGATVAEWIEAYRTLWSQGFYVVRVPDPSATNAQ